MQSDRIKEVFLATRTIFETQAKEAMELAMDKIYLQYLPHVVSDTETNVYFQTSDWIKRFLSDSLREDGIKIVAPKEWMFVIRYGMSIKKNSKELITKDIKDSLKILEDIHKQWQHRYF